jgi:hypothetical protein
MEAVSDLKNKEISSSRKPPRGLMRQDIGENQQWHLCLEKK